MKLHQLQALIAVAEGGGIRSAARGLGLSQSAVTRALRELEEEQGLPLLMRHAGGARLSDAGLVLLPHARQIASQLENAQRDLASLRGEVPTKLCVGVTPWFGQTLLAAAVRIFRREMPAVHLELYEGLQAVSLPLLRSGVMHFALGPAGALPSQEFVHEPLARYRMKVVACEGHPSQAAHSLAELLEQDWVMNFTQAGYEQVVQKLFGRYGYTVCSGRIVCAQSSAMLTSLIVDAGMLGYSPEPMLLCEPMRGRVRALELDEALADDDISLIRLRDQALDPAARCFIQCLQQVLKACVRSRNAEERRLADLLELLF
ncbi:LysR family transcriptional regulator [Pseudomonas aeruginosa]|uniref:LysR family transcriptional regulator n=1 Tax=Pseudomonas aeruginosa TaxID=287 RepID=A0A6A9K7X1_PSEAI|nr:MULTISPECIES: LysR family transcriptional regulator [Pseudomonas]MBG6714393.1 LysR family transcriptional regulator [Pseudomonas aeruginosa]MBG7427395.1 LysR family transcriptional regulator [Pseudomonas aeruginosa]MBG7461744.1 LysR family transcriptional regulator [Pseudomonas aeruginosa]MBV5796453.1 LysR family transcriptional regulator [Pseudomonas aeruginosa]MCV3848574.1 LysR family transcriptional regulator [Pseudomonas aeruginosa]